MSIDKMFEEYKTIEEFKTFCEAQNKTMLQLMKKNSAQAEEIEHLKKLVAGAVPIIKPEGSNLTVGTDEEEIAKIELRKLKTESMGPEALTLEQAKRVEIYSKILSSRMNKDNKNPEREVQELNTADLLAIAGGSEENKVN